MSTQTIVHCDIKGCKEEASHKQKTLSVTFTTETNEGRAVTPYLSGEKLDLCEEHYQEYIDRIPLLGSGAMGFNDYTFRAKK